MLGFLMLAGCQQEQPENNDNEFYLLVGTYTAESSEGIYLYRFDADSGNIERVSAVEGVENPSYLAVSPDYRYVYAVNELADSSEATLSAFSFNREEGQLIFLNRQSSGGGAPCYVAVDQNGSRIFAANYAGGSFSMLPVAPEGSLEAPAGTVKHTGSGPNEARQESPHVHCTVVGPDNRSVFVADLGIDQLRSYRFDAVSDSLHPEPQQVVETAPGAGPRHFTFHPDGTFAYLVNELDGTVMAFRYEEGRLEEIETVSALPEGYDGAVSGADIHVSPDGRFLYVSNRENLNSIALFSIDNEDGSLEYIDQFSSGGEHPRNFMIDPTGQYLLVANRNTDNIVVFKRDESDGTLTPTGTEVELSMPVFLTMVPVE